MKTRFRSLDCLRFIAAVGVILFHVNGRPGNWMSKLYLCVDLFFILSGFVLEPSFPTKRKSKEFFRFAVLRYIRLAPMLYATLIFSILYNLLIHLKNLLSGRVDHPSLQLTPSTIVISLLFLQIFSSQAILLNYPMWSLSSEWIINLLLVFPLSGNSRKRNAVNLCCLGVLIQISSFCFEPPEYLMQLSRCLTGIVAGVILRNYFQRKSTPISNRVLSLLVLLSVTSLYLASSANEKAAPLLSTFPFALLIFAFANFENLNPTKIPDAVANWAATLSFGVYAWHVPLAGIVESYSPGKYKPTSSYACWY